MAILLLAPSCSITQIPFSSRNPIQPPLHHNNTLQRKTDSSINSFLQKNNTSVSSLVSAGLVLSLVANGGDAIAAEFPLQLSEPENALSLPTWAIHVSSVVEWIAAMGLVWRYGETSGYESWKGLSWGMVRDAIIVLILF
ncbi:hypothetical protein IFM89_031695 [Coptis chinensis]|uniref:Ycf49-like protein n=1 Tax=Coptis chinensis TaxID=261450 RepID=A0A835HNN6_9MAGN|nr:hypothetical protein IFM89_031695 [Coptis chinensis]